MLHGLCWQGGGPEFGLYAMPIGGLLSGLHLRHVVVVTVLPAVGHVAALALAAEWEAASFVASPVGALASVLSALEVAGLDAHYSRLLSVRAAPWAQMPWGDISPLL